MKDDKSNAPTVTSGLNLKGNFKVDLCPYEAAKYAVLHWHYSKRMPSGKMFRVGVWENEFKGCVLFSRGANRLIASPYGLTQHEVCELTRVALREHSTPVTRIVRIAINLLKKHSPGLKLIISYADANQDHLGKIYQAGNWYYEGKTSGEIGVRIKGKITHRRTINSRYGTSDLTWLRTHIDPEAEVLKARYKFKYLKPLDKEMEEYCKKIAKPYPKEIE